MQPQAIFEVNETFTWLREPLLMRLPDGSLFCEIYTGGAADGDHDNVIAAVRSDDDGRTWSNLERSDQDGHPQPRIKAPDREPSGRAARSLSQPERERPFRKTESKRMSKKTDIHSITTEVVLHGRQHNQCWFSPGLAVVPATDPDAPPEVFIGVSQLIGNDMGTPHWIRTTDLGKHWTPPMESQNLLGIPHEDHWFEKPHVNLFFHRRSGRLLGLGSTHFSRDEGTHTGFKMEKIDSARQCPLPNRMVMTEWDVAQQDFVPWWTVALPDEFDRWHRVAWPRAQYEFPDGSVLVPLYLRETADDPYTAVIVMHADITDSGFVCRDIGNLLRVDTDRGLAEASVVHFKGRFLLTVRHDLRAFVATSDDGLHYGAPEPWRFDDGAELGNVNTQQHWLAQGDALFLLYNRRSELNNGVFRCRAPLYIARVDPERLCVIRDSERVVFPEKGARMGNFDVANVTDDEAWVVTGEWLEGMVPGMNEGDRFYVPNRNDINRIQYLGDLLLGRIRQ